MAKPITREVAEEAAASAVHAAAKVLNDAMVDAVKEGLVVHATVRQPDRLARRIYIDVTVTKELGKKP